ncbi:MAG: hypothetical protein ACLUD0_01440 [Eubacterium ramulus]
MVYGLGADAILPEGVKNLAAKGRLVLITIDCYIAEFEALIRSLRIFRRRQRHRQMHFSCTVDHDLRKAKWCHVITGGLDTVGCPHAIPSDRALALIRESGGYIVALLSEYIR